MNNKKVMKDLAWAMNLSSITLNVKQLKTKILQFVHLSCLFFSCQQRQTFQTSFHS